MSEFTGDIAQTAQEPQVAAFFRYARLREGVRIARENKHPWPWTTDPILRQGRFCNVFREDDKTTRWFADNLRDGLNGAGCEEGVLFATIAFRWFNRIETGQAILPLLVEAARGGGWNMAQAQRAIVAHVGEKGPFVTGAYVIKTPDGMTKLKGVLWCIQNIWDKLPAIYHHFTPSGRDIVTGLSVPALTLEGAWEVLRQYPYLGDFMAYEVVTDLRHTSLLDCAPDIMTWANPGPGACRGVDRLLGYSLGTLKRNSRVDRAIVMSAMRNLLAASREPRYWPEHYRAWEMREVEHTLCEFDKYERVRLGEGRMKQVYRPPVVPFNDI